MSNMSYCRFENTAKDLADCLSALRDEEANSADLSSEHEQRGKVRLFNLCAAIIDEFGAPDLEHWSGTVTADDGPGEIEVYRLRHKPAS